jgi:TolB-like protein/Tfp pilus assembly protein PilF
VTTKSSPSIAVLPFVNMSADPEQEYFCDGLAEELINALTQIKDLHVVARTSAFSFKGQNLDVREIGKKLNVETVLEGSVRKAGNRLRITGQLVNVTDGYHLWSERFDREMEDVFAIQDEISGAIVDRLRPRLVAKEKKKLAKHQTVDFETYSLYLKGRWFLSKMTGEAEQAAIECFTQVIEKAPDYAPAYAGLADAYIQLPFFAPFAPRQVFPMAKDAALKALDLDEELAETHVALANIKSFYDWDWEGAEREFRRAIELNPGHANAHYHYAVRLYLQTRIDEALKIMRIALEADPLSLHTNIILSEALIFGRRYDEAIAALKKAINMDPNYPLNHAYLGMAYFQKAQYEDAVAEFEKEKDILGGENPIVESLTGGAYALMGKQDEARKYLHRMIERSQQQYVSPCLIARICFALEETDDGFKWLDKAYEERDPFLCYVNADPFSDIIRSDSRFTTLLKKIGLEK